jgi:hypothetical protein
MGDPRDLYHMDPKGRQGPIYDQCQSGIKKNARARGPARSFLIAPNGHAAMEKRIRYPDAGPFSLWVALKLLYLYCIKLGFFHIFTGRKT